MERKSPAVATVASSEPGWAKNRSRASSLSVGRARVELVAWTIATVSFLYAYTRYVHGAGVPIDQLPLFLVNKTAAFAGIALFGAACVSRTSETRSRFGQLALGSIVVHVLFTMALLGPEYYGKLYRPDGRFSLLGGAALSCGAIGLVYLLQIFCVHTLGARGLARSRARVTTGTVVLLLAAAHVAFLGAGGWLSPESWALGMPPITLLGFVAAVGFASGPLVVRAVRAGWPTPSAAAAANGVAGPAGSRPRA